MESIFFESERHESILSIKKCEINGRMEILNLYKEWLFALDHVK